MRRSFTAGNGRRSIEESANISGFSVPWSRKTMVPCTKGKYKIPKLISSAETLHFTPWQRDLFIHVSFKLPREDTYLFRLEWSEVHEGGVPYSMTQHLTTRPSHFTTVQAKTDINPFSVGIDFRHQNLTNKSISALQGKIIAVNP